MSMDYTAKRRAALLEDHARRKAHELLHPGSAYNPEASTGHLPLRHPERWTGARLAREIRDEPARH